MPILSIDEKKQAQIATALGVKSLAVPEEELAKWTAIANDLLDAGKSGAALKTLNALVEPVTFLHGAHATLADLVVLGAAHDALARLPEKGRLGCLSVCRWYDHVQYLPGVAQLGLSAIAFERNVPLQATASSSGKGKDKKDKKDREAEKAARAAARGGDKDKGGKGGAGAAAPKGGALPDQPPASMLDMRVGHIIKAWRHPDADSLYVEEIDVGEEAPRTVVSGLVKFIPEAEMQNRNVVVLCNLKPSAMRGIKSFAMVLCCTSPDGSKVEFVTPPEGSKPGDRVTLPGMEGFAPLEQLPPKKKIFEAVQPDFATNAELVAQWKDLPFTVKDKGVCKVASIAGGSIK